MDALALHVNLSLASVANPGLASEMQEVAERAGLAPTRLRLELSGSALSEDARAGGAVAALRALGALVVADDLGAGGPTLAALATTPFDLLKLDRSLVASVDSDARARAVAAAIVALGSTLGLNVIAEGVERVEQLDELRDLGCHLAQGHLFGVAGALDLGLVDARELGADRDRLARRGEQRAEHAGRRGDDLGVDLVGLDHADRLVRLDVIALRAEPLDEDRLLHRGAQAGEQHRHVAHGAEG